MSATPPETKKPRVRRLAIWAALVLALIVWGAMQPPTRLEPAGWVGTLDT